MHQSEALHRIYTEISLFAQVWIYKDEPHRLASLDPKRRSPDSQTLGAMTTQFLYWLEYSAIENGVKVPAKTGP